MQQASKWCRDHAASRLPPLLSSSHEDFKGALSLKTTSALKAECFLLRQREAWCHTVMAGQSWRLDEHKMIEAGVAPCA